MGDTATTTLSGKLTRDVELRELPSGIEVARLRIASTTRRRRGQELVFNANHFTVEVYGAQARACSEQLGKGSHVVVKAEVEWREWTDEQNRRREAVIFRARQVLIDCARPTAAPETSLSARDTPASDPRS